eukprot:m.204201 g.204201  ORF g.204201 m.204201 type:complete len:713 (-) comp22441_c0_seq1:80-2218(-)
MQVMSHVSLTTTTSHIPTPHPASRPTGHVGHGVLPHTAAAPTWQAPPRTHSTPHGGGRAGVHTVHTAPQHPTILSTSMPPRQHDQHAAGPSSLSNPYTASHHASTGGPHRDSATGTSTRTSLVWPGWSTVLGRAIESARPPSTNPQQPRQGASNDNSCNATTHAVQVLTKDHWKPVPDVTPSCSWCHRSCGLLLRRQSWCARCGEITCSACLSERRHLRSNPNTPLSPPALDPSGTLARVCPGCTSDVMARRYQGTTSRNGSAAGVEDEVDTVCARDWTKTFRALRQGARRAAAVNVSPHNVDNVNVRANCAALTRAYARSIRTLGGQLSRALSPTSPPWTKTNIPKAGTRPRPQSCSDCHAAFSMTKRLEHCAICGGARCTSCLFRSALLYLDATGKANITVLTPTSKLPPRSEVVAACGACLQTVEDIVNARMSPPVSAAMWRNLLPIHAALHHSTLCIEHAMERYKGLVDSMRPDGPANTSPGQKLVKLLAKTQGDLDRLLVMYRTELSRLQALIPETNAFDTLLKNAICARAAFLRESKLTLGELNQVLGELLTPAALAANADELNKDALISATILVTQLAVESTLLASAPLSLELDGISREIRTELQRLVEKDGPQAWDDCLDTLTQTVRCCGQDRPLLRHLVGQPRAEQAMQAEVICVLQRLRWQLESRATLGAISTTLQCIDLTIKKVPGHVLDADSDLDGWEAL